MSSQKPENPVLSRTEFLRWGLAGAGGLGLLGAVGCQAEPQTVTQRSSSEQHPEGYVVAITHGPDDPARVMLALTTASRLPQGDNHVWFAIDGGQIALKETAATVTSPLFTNQGTAAEMLDQLKSKGIQFHI